jgi:guanylate kinase
MLFVLSGPSGVGKGTVSKRLRSTVPDLWLSVSWTTRAPRPDEVDGVDYVFVTKEQFEAERDSGGFYEWFEVFGDLKGTPRRPVEERLGAGWDVLLEIDVQGALKVKDLEESAVLIFLMPPSLTDLRARLQGRGTETEKEVARRLSEANREMARAPEFDHVVVNDDLERVVTEVAGILARSAHP